MKTRFFALLCVFASVAAAADLQLADGRIFKDYRIVSQTATTVTVRYADGIAKVEKIKLPPDLLSKYPVDEKAAEAEAAEIAKGKVLYETQAKATAEREKEAMGARAAATEKKRAQLDAVAAEVEKGRAKNEIKRQLAQDDATAALPGKILAAVRTRADRYFKTEYGSRSKLIFELKFDLDPPRPIDGWKNTFEVTGIAWYQYYESVWGGSFASSKCWFSARVELSTIRGVETIKVTDFSQRYAPPL